MIFQLEKHHPDGSERTPEEIRDELLMRVYAEAGTHGQPIDPKEFEANKASLLVVVHQMLADDAALTNS